MKFKVFLQSDRAFMRGALGEPVAFPGDYRYTATIEADSLRGAFSVTQNGDDLWIGYPSTLTAAPHAEQGARSFSVGDVLIDEHGHIIRCAPVGWDDIGWLAPSAMAEGIA